jgi:hypothetical protein
MDYDVFEGRALELFYKTDERVTAQLAAYRIGCAISQAKTFLEAMTANGILEMESDERGNIHFDMPGRPAASGQPLSWAVGTSPSVPLPPAGQAQMAPAHAAGMQSYPPPQPAPSPQQWNVPHGHVQQTHVQIQQSGPSVVYVAQNKSVVLAVLLAFFFGPLGMLYSTVIGALVTFFVGGALILVTLGVGILLVLPICMIWAGASAASHNKRLRASVAGHYR